MSTNNSQFNKLVRLLKELFQLDQPDLDFGFYRIMHARASEISQFLDEELLPQVQEAFSQYQTADKAEMDKELAELVSNIETAGMNPEDSPKVQELRQKIAEQSVDIAGLEHEVYDHLYKFFRRYYSEGDFLAKRVYKPGVYAIPYEGEEVKLHWANKDQYYIKTSEYLRDYSFALKLEADDPMRVHFRLVDAAEGAHNNVKESDQDKRVFILAQDDFIEEIDGENGKELALYFEYRPATVADWSEHAKAGATEAAKKKPPLQKVLAEDAVRRVLAVGEAELAPWIEKLSQTHTKADGEQADYSRLQAHLNRYTARNTFDYFIHKDLGGFLRRELDFYIKNEVMHLDDIESETAPRVAQYLSKIKVIRQIAGKLIDFLAQLENFQKKLWLKKKFVTETSWCIRLDCIPEEFYPAIAANDTQRQEWVELHAIDQLEGDLATVAYSNPLTEEFLKANPSLMVDTQNFGESFTWQLLAAVGNIEEQVDAILLDSENHQALSSMKSRYNKAVKCVYIDPPYNTNASPIAYKNGYRRSSWATLVADRIECSLALRTESSVLCVAIDDFEYPDLQAVIESISTDEYLATAAVRSKPQGRPTTTGFSANHEYAVFWGSPGVSIGRLPRDGSKAERYPYSDDKGVYSWANLRKSGSDSNRSDRKKSFYPIFVQGEEVWIPRMRWSTDEETWHLLEEPGESVEVVWPIDGESNEKVWTCSADRARAEIDDICINVTDDGHVELRKKYRPNQSGALPGTWWTKPDYSASESGTKVLKELFNFKEFDFPKSVNLVQDCLRVGNANGDDITLDFFAGSGTTGHAVTNLNRADGGRRKFILVEMGNYFDTVLLPRLKKVTFTPEWKNGKPKRLATSEEVERGPRMMKVVRLESYEDALNNLEVQRSDTQSDLLGNSAAQGNNGLREQYLLRYWLDVETRGSQSLLNVQAFTDPTAYKLKVKRPGSEESRETNVDLVETFNWLIGLTVEALEAPRTVEAAFKHDDDPDLPEDNPRRLLLDGRLREVEDGRWWFRTVSGTTPDDRKTLVIWRKLTGNMEEDNLVLDAWFQKQGYSSQDNEFDLIYVNGDNNLENLRQPDDTWKVRLIEEDFHRLMFEEAEA